MNKSIIVAKRIELCKACDRLTSFNTCKECGCFMPAKTRIKSAECPLKKWGRVVDLEERSDQLPEIVNALNNAPIKE